MFNLVVPSFEGFVTVSTDVHCVKRVRIRSYSGPYFPTFRLDTDQIMSEYGHF